MVNCQKRDAHKGEVGILMLIWIVELHNSSSYVDCSIFVIPVSYNALERREASKGGKEASKKSTTSHSSAKGSTAASRPQTSQNARKNDASVISGNQTANVSKPSSNGLTVTAYDEQVN